MRYLPTPLASAVALCTGLLAGTGHAAGDTIAGSSDDTEQQQAASGTTPAGGAATAVPGGWQITPKISLGLRFDDNIYATPDNAVDDLIFTLSPAVEARSNWQTHALSLRAGANLARYQDHASENTDDYWLEAKGRYDLSPQANLFGGVKHAFAHEDRESADDLAATTPTTYRDHSLYGGLLQRFGDGLSLRLGGSYRQLDYDNVPNLLGQVNDDRDREVLTGALRLGKALTGGSQWFVQGSVDQRRYRLRFDDNGYHRDSTGYRLQTGLRWRDGGMKGDVYVGYMGQDYDAGNLSDVAAVDFGGSMSWQVGPRTKLRLAVERSIEETTLAGASSYLWTTLSAGVTYQLAPRLSLSAAAGMMEADYQGTGREDDFAQGTLGAKYQIDRRRFLSASYRFLARDSNDDTVDFDRNQLALVFGWEF